MRCILSSALLTAASAALLVHSEAGAQYVGIPPLPDSTRQRITGEISAPNGFELSVFAGPPHLTYPTCLYAASGGVVFVGTDPNLLFGRERHLGRILQLVDDDADGVADRYTIFADSLDAVRGVTFDGEAVYAMHAPTLSAYRDLDGDGVADEKRVLVEGLGFGLDDRNGDHSSNGLRLGIDGWIYIAVGDYGFLEATGTDGVQAYLHAGGVLRVRPDGTELEVVARGTRNIYDVALDPELRIFARDNTNNGQGWNSRFHYLPAGADVGYPSRFRNFPEEILPSLADFGPGAATTAVWVEEATYPEPLRSTLLSADWALNRVYRHELSPRGATFGITQEEILSIPNPVDLEVDPAGNLFVASLSGGSYEYAGEHVGFIARLRPIGARAPPPPAAALDDSALVDRLLSPSAMRRLEAQQAILSRAATPPLIRGLERVIRDAEAPTPGRIAALFTLKQVAGPRAHETIVRAASDSGLRAMALRALADRRGELTGIPASLFVEALGDADPFVRLQAVTGLSRIAPSGAAEHLMRAATDSDTTVAHVALNHLARMGSAAVAPAVEALDREGEAQRQAALRVLARQYSSDVVTKLAARANVGDRERQREVLAALARLHHREGFWGGEWWGNQPDTEGPYYDPVGWEESPRIRSVLISSLLSSAGDDRRSRLAVLEREGLIPRESAALLDELATLDGGEWQELVDLLVGGRELRPPAAPALTAIAGAHPDLREAVARIAVALRDPPPHSAALIRAAVDDRALPVELRARALGSLTRLPPADHRHLLVAAFAAVVAELPQQPPLMQAWRRYTGDSRRVEELASFAALAERGSPQERVLAYAVLVQIAGLNRNPEDARMDAAASVASAWSQPATAEPLRQAIALLGVEDRYPNEMARPLP